MKRLMIGKIAILVVPVVLAIPFIGNAGEVDKTQDGYWWDCVGVDRKVIAQVLIPKEMNVDELCSTYQMSFMLGYVMGTRGALDALNESTSMVKDPYQKARNKDLIEILDLRNLNWDQLRSGLTQFYSDLRNKKIDIDMAIYIVKEEMRGAKKEYIKCVKEAARIQSQGTEEEFVQRLVPCVSRK